MAVTFIEPGGDAEFGVNTLANNGLWRTVGAAPAIATDFVHGGHIKSIRFRPSNADLVSGPLGIVADAGGRLSFYLYLAVLPNANSRILGIRDNSALIVAGLWLTSTGVLKLQNATPTQIGTDGATLATGTWYRISIAYTIASTSVNRFELFVDGVSSISITNATLINIVSNNLIWGNASSNSALDMRMSDFYVDNSNSLTDTGNVWVTAKRPVSDGTAIEFTTQVGVGGSGYGSGHTPQVNERPLSVTNGWSISTTTRKTEEYTIEAKGVGDIDISNATIVDYMGWISAGVDSTSDSPVHRMMLGGTLTAKTMTTSPDVYLQMGGSSTYPTGGTDIGMDAQYTTNPHVTSLYECGIVVAYIPGAAGGTAVRRRMMSGIGQ